MNKYLYLAAKTAISKRDERSFLIGAIAIRNDNVIVRSSNGPSKEPCANAHAEARLSKKIDNNSIIYVARVLKNGNWALAKPCPGCINFLKRRKVKRIYFTTGPNSWDTITLS